MSEQMTLQDYRKIVHEELEKCGIKIPVELKFDLTWIAPEHLEKTKEFLRLCGGDWQRAVYVEKSGERDGDVRYFDLLFCVNNNGEPICIPVPLARKLFGTHIASILCRAIIPGWLYEYIYRAYYNASTIADDSGFRQTGQLPF